MPSANDCYQKIMSTLQTIKSSSLSIFLQQQTLSIMRGMQISDNNKIHSMLILLKAATLIDNNSAYLCLFNQLLLELDMDDHFIANKYIRQIERSTVYIEKSLNNQIDKITLKSESKPWLLQSKQTISQRTPLGLKKPESNVPGSGLIPTKNAKGWELPPLESDVFTHAFEESLTDNVKKRILILGAGYGSLVYKLLASSEHNNTKFVVNDLASEHMDIFKDQLPTHFDSRVTVIHGDLLSIDFPNNHFDNILLQNVMHFFTPEQVEQCLRRIYNWLKPNGSLTLTVATPYWGNPANEFVKTFHQKKAEGDQWPGFIPNLREFVIKRNDPQSVISTVPEGPLHNFDDTILSSCLTKQGFLVAKNDIGFFAMPKTFPKRLQGEGKEYVGAKAYKPV